MGSTLGVVAADAGALSRGVGISRGDTGQQLGNHRAWCL